MQEINSEASNVYDIQANDDVVIERAIAILDRRIKHGDALCSPTQTRAYLRLQLAEEKAEVFCCLFLDNRNRVIAFKRLFHGTIDGASVYPREVVREAISQNAAAIIFAHNHPSGVAEPSHADEQITQRLKDALALIDVRVLDHIVVGDECVSFAERGLI
jgi:DNA repair protein RadC